MLVAPLKLPVSRLSLASLAGEEYIFRRALTALVEGILLAIGLSMLLGWLAQVLQFNMLVELP